MVIGQIANVGIRAASRYFRELHRIDVKIHKGLYGASAGRGVRHGRDAGIFLSQYYNQAGDDVEVELPESPYVKSPGTKAGKFNKTRGRYQRKRVRCSPKRNRYNSSY